MIERCSDFELAPLTEYPKDMFRHTTDVDLNAFKDFTLALCVIYNEIKTITWLAQKIDNGWPETIEISPYCGQIIGMHWNIVKMLSCISHEVVHLFKEQQKVIYGEISKEVFKTMSGRNRVVWSSLVNFSKKDHSETGDDFSRFLKAVLKIRNNIGYHYYNTKGFQQGYSHWLNSDHSENSNHVYASLGDTLEETRFYVGDTASSGFIQKTLGELNLTDAILKANIDLISLSFRFYIEHAHNMIVKKNQSVK